MIVIVNSIAINSGRQRKVSGVVDVIEFCWFIIPCMGQERGGLLKSFHGVWNRQSGSVRVLICLISLDLTGNLLNYYIP